MYQIAGYDFTDQKLAAKAEVEASGVNYIKSRTRLDNPEHIKKLYDQMIDGAMFSTPVGFAYLSELRQYLLLHLSELSLTEEEIKEIPVGLYLSNDTGEINDKTAGLSEEDKMTLEEMKEELRIEKRETRKKREESLTLVANYRKKLRICFFFTVVLGLIIVGMFTITLLSTNNVTILNYENEIINKYEEWEQELSEREASVREKEAALEEKQ